jgi:hypothetical protein
MRQRNDTGYPLLVAADPPFTVEDGETVDHPELVAGLTDLDAKTEDETTDGDPAETEPTEPTEPVRPPRRRARADHDETPGEQL